jgi:hypothetical protein
MVQVVYYISTVGVAADLAATLVSLQRVGMGRAVVVGLSDADKAWALSSFEQVQQVQHDGKSLSSMSMQLAFVVAPGLSPEVIQNTKQASLSLPHLLQKQALRGSDVASPTPYPSLLGAPVQSWLGEKSPTGNGSTCFGRNPICCSTRGPRPFPSCKRLWIKALF